MSVERGRRRKCVIGVATGTRFIPYEDDSDAVFFHDAYDA
jgi:hypothetical protein